MEAQRWIHGLIEGLHTKIKQLKRLRDGFCNRDRYRSKLFRGFLPSTAFPLYGCAVCSSFLE